MKVFKVNDLLGWTGYHGIEESSKDYDVVINVGHPNPRPLHGKEHITVYMHDDDGHFKYDKMYELAKLMDERMKQGKRVLVHCLEGNSRSASLIMAWMTTYGDFKDWNNTDGAWEVLEKIKPHAWGDGRELFHEPSRQHYRHWFKRDWPLWMALHKKQGEWVPIEEKQLDAPPSLV